jgi:hypothetical protein
MKRRAASISLAAVIACIAAAPATQACSDKLSIIGGGVTYDMFAGEHRGNIVLLVEPNSPLRAANDDLKLRQALQKAGHRVRMVESTAELAGVLDKTRVDVVLVSWSQRDRVEQQLATRTSGPATLGVGYKQVTANAVAASNQGQCFILVTDSHDSALVHRVGELVAQRSKPGAQRCEAPKAPSTTTS